MLYKVVKTESSSLEETIEKLEKQVNELCQKGWKVRGSVSVIKKENEWYQAYQAVIRR